MDDAKYLLSRLWVDLFKLSSPPQRFRPQILICQRSTGVVSCCVVWYGVVWYANANANKEW